MTQISTPDACHTFGFVDNASALPTTPQVPFQNPKRTFDLFYPADIFTRQRQRISPVRWPDDHIPFARRSSSAAAYSPRASSAAAAASTSASVGGAARPMVTYRPSCARMIQRFSKTFGPWLIVVSVSVRRDAPARDGRFALCFDGAMCGRPRGCKGVFWCDDAAVGSGHVSGLLVRCT